MLATLTAEKLVNDIFNAGLFIMIVSLVMSLGMGFSVAHVVAPMRRVAVIVPALLLNVLITPIVAWGIFGLFPISNKERIGLVLVCVASAGPAGLKAAQLAKRADMALAVSLVIILQVVNIVAAPLWARTFVTGATISAWVIVKDLFLLVLIPLAVGLVAHNRYSEHASAWRGSLERVSNIALYVAIAAGIAVNWSTIVSLLGSWVLVASATAILVFMLLGALLGIRDRPTAITGAMVTGMRFQPIGLIVISTQLNGVSAYLAPALVFALIDTFLMFGIGIELGRRSVVSVTEP